MGRLITAFHLCMNNIRRWGANPRFLIIAVLGSLWIHFLVSPLLHFSQLVDVRITPWVFPFVLINWYPSMVILLGVVLLFCDAPFMNNSTPYECVRSGRRLWILGQIMYVVLASLIYVLFLVLVSILCLLPNLEISDQWGKVINTLAQTSAGNQYSQIPISYRLMLSYSPIEAMLISSLILFLETTLIGVVMLAINTVTNRIGGVLAGLVLGFMPAFVGSILVEPKFFYFVPTAWSNIDMLDVTGKSMYPSLPYVLCVLIGLIILLIGIILKMNKTREIEVLMPV